MSYCRCGHVTVPVPSSKSGSVGKKSQVFSAAVKQNGERSGKYSSGEGELSDGVCETADAPARCYHRKTFLIDLISFHPSCTS